MVTTMSLPAPLKPLLILTAAVAMAGCTVSDRDVSRDPHFLVGYHPGEVYELVQSVPMLRIDKEYFELLRPGETREYGKPAGMLAAGSRIRIISLRHHVSAAPIQWESGVTTTAQLVDRTEWTLALNSISGVRWIDGDCGMKTGVLVPDPQWLALVGPDPVGAE
jgi:hypothetical protein